MADEKITFGLDVDAKKGIDATNELRDSIVGLGDQKNLSGLLSGLSKVGIAIGVVGGAMFALKKAFDLVQEGEKINMLNESFEILSKQSGIAGENLRKGLTAASDNVIGEMTLIEIANKAMVSLGKAAERLPEILELSKKAAIVAGQSVGDTYQKLVEAISTGQTRALKQMGIVVDQEMAYRKYAATLGTTAAALTENAKRQAIMNAVLESGQKSLGGIQTKNDRFVDSIAKAKETFQDITETVQIFFEKTLGPYFRKAIGWTQEFAKGLKTNVIALIGDGAAKTEAQISIIDRRIEEIKKAMEPPKQKDADGFWGFLTKSRGGTAVGEIENLKKELDSLVEKRDKLASTIAKPVAEAPAPVAGDLIDVEKQAQQQAAFLASFNTLQQNIIDARQKTATSTDEIANATSMRLALLEEQTYQQIEQIRANFNLNQDQRRLLEEEAVRLSVERRKEIEIQAMQDIQNAEVAALENRIKVSQSANDQFVLGMKLATAKNKRALSDMAAFGSLAVNSMAGAFSTAFEQVGQGGISLGEALTKAIVGSVADIAAAKGKELIAASIFPPQPLGLAAGAGLLALSGVLRSSVGATAAVPSGGATAGAGGEPRTAISPAERLREETPEPQEFQQKKSVTLQVMGNYFETEETKTKLVQMIREASDATDFKILSVGGGI